MRHSRSAVLAGLLCCSLPLQSVAANLQGPVLNSSRDLTSLSVEDLGNIQVTTVSKNPEPFKTAAAAVFVITQDDIRRSGVTSIPEALRMAPGVNVERINSNQWSVGVRGFGDHLARSVLVLIDGRAVYTPLFGGVFWEVQDYLLEDIDRIEVIRGPGGSLWGANAFNGVINIITQSAKDTHGGYVTTGGGTEERGFGSARYGGQSGALHYRVYGKYFNRDNFYHADNNDFDAWQKGQGGFRTDWDLSERDSLTLQGDLYGGRIGEQNTLASFSPPYRQTFRGDADVSGANFLGRWNRKIDSRSETSLQWYYDRTNRLGPDFRENRDTADLDFQHRFAGPWNQELTWGLGYRFSANRMDFPEVMDFGDPPNRADHLVNVFFQNEVPLIDVLRLTFGAKVEHNDYSGWEFEPSGRLTWTPSEHQSVWTSVSRAVRTPTQGDQDFSAYLPSNAPAFIRLIGDKEFKSETLTAYEVGYRVQPVPPVFLDIAAFYNRYDDLRTGELGTAVLENPSNPRLVLPVVQGNKMEGETHGMEWASTWNAFSWWRWRLTYSLLLIHLRLEPDSLDPSPRPEDTAGSSPRHQAALRWSMDLPYGFEWDPTIRYTDVRPKLATPAYWSLDMRVAWHATQQLELSLTGQNLLQEHHPEASASQEIPRGFYGRASYKW